MPSSSNKRLFYPAVGVAIAPDASGLDFRQEHVAYGVQSVGVTTDYPLQPIFQMGMQEIYENVEDIPDVQISMQKVLDGRPLLYHLATTEATSNPTMVGRSAAKCSVGLANYNDTNTNASGTPLTIMGCSGMFVNSVSYSFGTAGSFTEDVTLVGNNKVWYKSSLGGPPTYGAPDHTTLPAISWSGNVPDSMSPLSEGGIAQSEDIIFTAGASDVDSNGAIDDKDTTVLPPEVYGISNSGLNEKSDGQNYDAHISDISCSVDLSRENLDELGRRGPYHRSVTLPVEVTCEITTISTEGDLISAIENGIYTGAPSVSCPNIGTNLKNRTIRIATCEGTRIYLGRKNKLQSVNHSGGDTDGGNVSVTYTYSTFNDFTVIHSGDPVSNWWTSGEYYLEETP